MVQSKIDYGSIIYGSACKLLSDDDGSNPSPSHKTLSRSIPNISIKFVWYFSWIMVQETVSILQIQTPIYAITSYSYLSLSGNHISVSPIYNHTTSMWPMNKALENIDIDLNSIMEIPTPLAPDQSAIYNLALSELF